MNEGAGRGRGRGGRGGAWGGRATRERGFPLTSPGRGSAAQGGQDAKLSAGNRLLSKAGRSPAGFGRSNWRGKRGGATAGNGRGEPPSADGPRKGLSPPKVDKAEVARMAQAKLRALAGQQGAPGPTGGQSGVDALLDRSSAAASAVAGPRKGFGAPAAVTKGFGAAPAVSGFGAAPALGTTPGVPSAGIRPVLGSPEVLPAHGPRVGFGGSPPQSTAGAGVSTFGAVTGPSTGFGAVAALSGTAAPFRPAQAATPPQPAMSSSPFQTQPAVATSSSSPQPAFGFGAAANPAQSQAGPKPSPAFGAWASAAASAPSAATSAPFGAAPTASFGSAFGATPAQTGPRPQLGFGAATIFSPSSAFGGAAAQGGSGPQLGFGAGSGPASTSAPSAAFGAAPAQTGPRPQLGFGAASSPTSGFAFGAASGAAFGAAPSQASPFAGNAGTSSAGLSLLSSASTQPTSAAALLTAQGQPSQGSSAMTPATTADAPTDPTSKRAAEGRAARFRAEQAGAAATVGQLKGGPGKAVGVTDGGVDPIERPIAGNIVGMCDKMCSDAEVEERMNSPHVLERADPRQKVSRELMVAHHRRNNNYWQDRNIDLATVLRTLPALERTQHHLISLFTRTDVPRMTIYNFVWDRFRAIYKELDTQGLKGPRGVRLIEQHVRFMLVLHHEMAESKQDHKTFSEGFDPGNNLQQLETSLNFLDHGYKIARARGAPLPNEAEFRAYMLVRAAVLHERLDGVLKHFTELPQKALVSGPAWWALRAVAAMQPGEGGIFVRFFRALERGPPIQACLLYEATTLMRVRAVSRIVRAMPPKGRLPIVELAALLGAADPKDVVDVVVAMGSHDKADAGAQAEDGGQADGAQVDAGGAGQCDLLVEDERLGLCLSREREVPSTQDVVSAVQKAVGTKPLPAIRARLFENGRSMTDILLNGDGMGADAGAAMDVAAASAQAQRPPVAFSAPMRITAFTHSVPPSAKPAGVTATGFSGPLAAHLSSTAAAGLSGTVARQAPGPQVPSGVPPGPVASQAPAPQGLRRTSSRLALGEGKAAPESTRRAEAEVAGRVREAERAVAWAGEQAATARAALSEPWDADEAAMGARVAQAADAARGAATVASQVQALHRECRETHPALAESAKALASRADAAAKAAAEVAGAVRERAGAESRERQRRAAEAAERARAAAEASAREREWQREREAEAERRRAAEAAARESTERAERERRRIVREQRQEAAAAREREASLRLRLRMWRRQAARLREARDREERHCTLLSECAVGAALAGRASYASVLKRPPSGAAPREGKRARVEAPWQVVDVLDAVRAGLLRREGVAEVGNAEGRVACVKVAMATHNGPASRMAQHLVARALGGGDGGPVLFTGWSPSRGLSTTAVGACVVRCGAGDAGPGPIAGASGVLGVAWGGEGEAARRAAERVAQRIREGAGPEWPVTVAVVTSGDGGAGAGAGAGVGGSGVAWREFSADPGGLSAALGEALGWLASRAPPDPQLWSLRPGALAEAVMQGAARGRDRDAVGQPGAGLWLPGAAVAAFNGALLAARAAVDRAAETAHAKWGWPGPELLAACEDTVVPPGPFGALPLPARSPPGAASKLLSAAALPPWPASAVPGPNPEGRVSVAAAEAALAGYLRAAAGGLAGAPGADAARDAAQLLAASWPRRSLPAPPSTAYAEARAVWEALASAATALARQRLSVLLTSGDAPDAVVDALDFTKPAMQERRRGTGPADASSHRGDLAVSVTRPSKVPATGTAGLAPRACLEGVAPGARLEAVLRLERDRRREHEAWLRGVLESPAPV